MSQPVIVLASGPPPPDPYGGAMASEFNWCHRLLFPRFFRKVRVDGTPPACLQELATRGTLIYVTPFIGQLELQFFNHMALSHRLPLARFVNDLRNIWWRPWRNRRGYRRTKSLPHPVRSGYLAGLLRDHHSVLLRLRTSRGYDDLFWDDPAEDPLVPLIHLQRTSASPLYMVPMQFFWERRPSARRKGLIDLLFGERDHPGWLRRFVRFWRHYAAGATAHIGEPIALADFLQGHLTQDDTSAARVLRQRLLGQIHQEKLIATGPPLKPRRWIIEQISETEGVQRVVYSSARETGKSVEDFKQLARQYADEIAADIRYGYIELAERVLRWVFRNIYDGIAVDEAGFAAVKRAMAAGPTIFVPSHRSHVDGMILSYLLFQHRLATPHLAAGINMAFWPAGPFFRRCGAFFLRRTFGKNPLYRAVFAEYITLLLREQYSVEFFIEGGRSRTGKSLKPRMGILSTMVDAMRAGVAPDCTFIPIAITYDQVIEQRTYLAELSGGTKVQERGWHLLRMGRYLKRRSGRIYFNFGESISYVKTLQRAAPEIGSPTALTDAAKPALVRELASTIMYAMNREAVVTPAALVATALLTPMQRAVTETELLDIVDQLCRYLQWKGAKFSEPLQRDREEALREVLQRLASGPSRLISRHEAFQPVCYALEEGRRLQLDYSKNTIIHFFASLGCLAVLLRTRFLHGEEEIVVAKLEGDYERLKRLFQEEFTFSTRLKPIEHITRLVQYLREAGLVEASEADEACIRVTPPGATRLRLFSGLLRNFFESYKVALLAGLQIPSAGLEEKALVKMMIRYGEHLLLLGRIRCPEAISQANFQNAIRAYKTIGLFSESGDQLKGKKVLIWQGDNPEGAQLQQALEEWC